MKVTIPDLGKGVNKDAQASELELGLWSGVENFRPSNGFMEKWDGVSTLFSTSTTATWLIPYLYQTTRYVVYGGTAVYARDSSTSTQITPYIASQTITVLTNSGATTAGVTTGSAHGLTTGDTITVFGCTDTDYNVTDAAITVTGATTFTYPCGAIAAPASVIGEYIVTSSSALMTITAQDWQAIVLNGYVVINRPNTGLFYWAGDTAVKFKRFPFLSYSAFSMLAYKNYIVLLGPYVGGVKKPRRVAWSNAAEVGALPTSFTASDTNDAGNVELGQTDGDLVGGLEFNDVAYLYTQDARYAMRYIGGNDVFSFIKTGTEGMFGRYCVTNTPVGQVFVTAGLDVHIHQGGASRSIADGTVKDYIRSIMYVGSSSKQSYLATNPRKKEVWFVVYTDATARTAILSWNWETGKWGIFTVPSGEAYFATNGPMYASASSLGMEQDLLIVSKGSSIGIAGGPPSGTEVGTWFGTSLTGTLERTGLHFDDRDITKSIQRSRWNIDGTATNTASIYHGASMYADTAPTYTSAATYTIGTTDYVNARSTMGRFGAIKLSTTAYPFRIRSVDLDVTTGGKR